MSDTKAPCRCGLYLELRVAADEYDDRAQRSFHRYGLVCPSCEKASYRCDCPTVC